MGLQARENVTVRWDVGLNRKKLAFFTIPRDEAQLRLAPGMHLTCFLPTSCIAESRNA